MIFPIYYDFRITPYFNRLIAAHRDTYGDKKANYKVQTKPNLILDLQTF